MRKPRVHPSLFREYNVLYVKDVMRILGTGKSKSYEIIRKLNKELAEKGVLKDALIPGRVPEKYFRERVFLDTSTPSVRG